MPAPADDPIDYSTGPTADRHRREKAKRLARILHDQGVPADLAETFGPDAQHDHVKAAGLRTNHPDALWALTVEALRFLEQWYAHNGATPNGGTETPRAAIQQAGDCASSTATGSGEDGCTVEKRPAGTTPKGWDAVAALPLLERADARCRVCGGQAVIGTPNGWACPNHPPAGSEWGVGLDWTPKPHMTCAPKRCYCGRCPSYEPSAATHTPPSASALLDEKAIASGKRRSAPEDFRAARAAEDARRQARTARTGGSR